MSRIGRRRRRRSHAELTDLDDLLRRSDAVSLYVPLNDETRHVLDARRLDLMPPHTFLITCGRGAVAALDALPDALRAGRLGGAGIDTSSIRNGRRSTIRSSACQTPS